MLRARTTRAPACADVGCRRASTVTDDKPACVVWLVLLFIGSVALAQAQSPPTAGRDVIRYSRRGADTCLSCHEDEHAKAIFQTAHGNPSNPRSPFGDGQLQCESCHGPGGAHAARVRRGRERPPTIRFGAASTTPIEVQNGKCLACHNLEVGPGWHAGPHDTTQVACADCHAVHSARDPMLTTELQPQACYRCHVLERAEALRPFAHPLHEGKMDCSACHSPHRSSAEYALARDTVNETCYQCHADKRGPFLWEHAPVAEDCTLCHAPHGSNQPGMLTLRAPLLCQTCHAEQGHPSVAEGIQGLAGATPSRFLLGQNCSNCHPQVHGSNHPSGARLMR
jgi:DmsE family decaheme c-type cytochrome